MVGASTPHSAAFARAVAHVLEWEGEWSYDPQGGRTRWGFAQMAHPTLDLATFTREDAIARYHVEYWAPIQGDALPPPVAFAVFDGAVQHDPVTAIRLLQRVVNAYPYDGRMGPHTLARTVAADVRTTVHHYCARRAVYYAQLPHGVEAHMYGWMRRLFATYTAALV